jgi:hypothetical protein
VAQEVVHSLPKAALPAHGLKVDSTTVPLVGLLEKMTVNQLVLTINSILFSSCCIPGLLLHLLRLA